MLTWAFSVLGLAAIGGVALVALSQWRRPTDRVWLPGVAHGLTGLAGFILLLLGLRGPPRGVQIGASGFGAVAAVLIGLALALGLAVVVSRLRRRPVSPLALGIHATLAVAGLVMLAAYVSA